MKLHSLITLFFLQLFLPSFLQECNAKDISVSEIPSLNQLPVNAIHRIFQDSEGYMWYGTVDGLCRDDGYSIRVFRSDLKTPKLIKNNLVEAIVEDKRGRIWFGTDNGVYILDKKTNLVTPLDEKRLSAVSIYCMYSTSDGYIWIPVKDELLKYDINGELVKSYRLKLDGSNLMIGHLCESRNGDIYVTAFAGIYLLDKKRDSFDICYSDKMKNRLSFITQDREEDYFWVSSWRKGIVRFNPAAKDKDSVFVYQPLPLNQRGEESNMILYITQDDNLGYLWATTSHDVAAFEKTRQGMLKQVSLKGMLPPLNRMLNEIIKDKSGNLWVAAFDQPSFIIHFNDDIPRCNLLPAIRRKFWCNPAVMGMLSANDDILWISQERTGICLYNIANDEVKSFEECNQTKLLELGTSKELKPTLLKNGVWILAENINKLYRLTRLGMEMRLENDITIKVNSSNETAKKIIEDSKGKAIWIGSDKSLYKYDLNSNTIKCVLKDSGWVTSFFMSEDGVIWMCTSTNGFYRIDKDDNIVHYSFQHHFSCISMTTDGVVWLGSEEGGLYSYSEQTKRLTSHSSISELNGDQINQLVVDDFNHIWIDTNQKLIEYNPRNGLYRTYFTTDNNIQLWRFIPTSFYKGSNEIIFGGIPGICSFIPSNRLDSEAHKVTPYITDIRVRGNSALFNRDENNYHVELKPDDRNIEISFSTLNYRFAHKIRYAYRIKEIDSDWVYMPTGRNIAYLSSLPKGNYTFQVKATDENGLWSNEITELSVYRRPAFYESWWAYLLYFFVSIILFGYWEYRYHRRIERKNSEMWADSSEMIKMKQYLDSEITPQEPEYIRLDKMLVDNATKCVENNLSSPTFDVAALADAMNMSRSTFSRKLKTITGRTPLDFIRNVKMKHACVMLEDKDRNIAEIASTLGYLNRKYFTTCFKDEFGITPSEYQKQIED